MVEQQSKCFGNHSKPVRSSSVDVESCIPVQNWVGAYLVRVAALRKTSLGLTIVRTVMSQELYCQRLAP